MVASKRTLATGASGNWNLAHLWFIVFVNQSRDVSTCGERDTREFFYFSERPQIDWQQTWQQHWLNLPKFTRASKVPEPQPPIPPQTPHHYTTCSSAGLQNVLFYACLFLEPGTWLPSSLPWSLMTSLGSSICFQSSWSSYLMSCRILLGPFRFHKAFCTQPQNLLGSLLKCPRISERPCSCQE